MLALAVHFGSVVHMSYDISWSLVLCCWSLETLSFGGKEWGMVYDGWCINIRYSKNQGWKYKMWVIILEGIDFVLKENHSIFCLGMPDIFLIFTG